jgi:hypothetical protein
MTCNKLVLASLFAAIIVSAALSSYADAQTITHTVPGAGTTVGKPVRLEPCWQVAGISKAAMEQRKTLNLQTRQQVEAVCANSSLSPQQKRQQIQQIHRQEKEQLDGIITPAQQQAMRSCQSERNAGHVSAGHVGGTGPCGEMPTGQQPSPQPGSDTPPNEAKPD